MAVRDREGKAKKIPVRKDLKGWGSGCEGIKWFCFKFNGYIRPIQNYTSKFYFTLG